MLLGPLNCRPSMLISRVPLSLGCKRPVLALAVKQVQETRICVISSGSFQMLVILKVCLSCAPRGTTPKSCVVFPPNILSAHAGVWARAELVKNRRLTRAATAVRMLVIPRKDGKTQFTPDSTASSDSGEGGFAAMGGVGMYSARSASNPF